MLSMASTTTTSNPFSLNSHAASSPNKPPPITTTFLDFSSASFTLYKSFIFLRVNTFSKSWPLIGGIKFLLPVAITSLSNLIAPSFTIIVLFTSSNLSTFVPNITTILFLSYQSLSSM